MDMTNLKPNSHKSKEEQQESEKTQRKLDKVVRGGVKTKKKSEMSKLASVFIAEDAKNVKSYVFMDVMVPAIKKALVDIVVDGVNMIFYGGARGGSRSSNGSKISYRSFYDKKDSPVGAPRTRERFDYDDILFDNRGDAEVVLTQLDEALERYDYVTYADLYDAAGLTPPFTSHKYGWTNLRNAEVVRGRDGYYVIKMPKAMPID